MTADKHEDTDDRLLQRVAASDMESFRALFEKYQPVLFRSILHSTRDVDTAQDIVQETFVRVWQKRETLQPHLPFLAYIFRISRNLVLDAVKHREVRSRPMTNATHTLSAPNSPENVAELGMLEERLSKAVRDLPERCREIFLLSRMEGMSNGEISRQLGLSSKTVENHITRALKFLRRRLRDYINQ